MIEDMQKAKASDMSNYLAESILMQESAKEMSVMLQMFMTQSFLKTMHLH